jgi:hypothetical protein
MFRPYYNGHLQASIPGGAVNTIAIRNIRDLVSRVRTAVYILFLRLLYGAGRFICLLAVYAQFVDGSPSIISAALIPAVRCVSGCRACLCGNRNMYCGRIGVIIRCFVSFRELVCTYIGFVSGYIKCSGCLRLSACYIARGMSGS